RLLFYYGLNILSQIGKKRKLKLLKLQYYLFQSCSSAELFSITGFLRLSFLPVLSWSYLFYYWLPFVLDSAKQSVLLLFLLLLPYWELSMNMDLFLIFL